ncbi:hypothetical protein CY34DRAFT_15905 [Suillus luteus UH-Slu-Lm8-n1]|uniref:Unplaced genomic scaffold CY34scaffold_341, whole genome shotgun sequence n=1 Tax=Suillus luteus UH-Slu-Lm8-n1 TaxID=930992 RepID=A0A0D0ASD2_9AGAM|nr:hypothetical protein CY34DRAFT_15905 [Suillus luteus UH-Slu-Lm8-n1]
MQIEERSPFCEESVKEAEGVEAVCEQYLTERKRIVNAAEGRRRAHEVEIRRLRMEGLAEGRAQGQSEIDELRRQGEEARKQREETERKADQGRRTADERQWEEMKRKAGKLGLHGCSD